MQNSTDTAEAVAGGYYVLHLLPAVPDDAESILATIEMRCAEQVAGSRQPTDRQAMTRARRGYQLKGFAKLPPNLNGDQHRVWRRLLELIQ